MENKLTSTEALQAEIEELRHQLYEANETIEAIRTGSIDALVVESADGHQLYTLKTADHSYRVFIEKMTEGAVTLNSDGIILYANTKFAGMVQLPLSDVIGIPFLTFIADANKPFYESLFHTCWNADCKGEVELTAAGGNTAVQLSLTALTLDDGVSLNILLTDLTLQKATQQQLEQNNRQLEQMNKDLEASNHDLQQFASVASHDLQEPLRKIQIFANLLKDRHHNELSDGAQSYLRKISDSAARMKSMIIDVLDYSKLSATGNAFAQINLNDMLQELLTDLDLAVQEKNAVITVSNLPLIEANCGQMRQAFQNILSNALKFSKKEVAPAIRITAKRLREKSFTSDEQEDGAFCLIKVKDNGIGFNDIYANTVFSLFERLHSKDRYEGTGIGLAITKKIVEKHNGLITVKSREGAGAEFLMLLPVKQTSPI